MSASQLATAWSPAFEGVLPLNYLTPAGAVLKAIRERLTIEPVPEGVIVTDWASPVPKDHVRIVCISDTHNAHTQIRLPAGDVLVHAGDFSDTGSEGDIVAFCGWLKAQTQFKHRIVIAGNHETSLCRESYDRNWKRFRHPRKYDVESLEAALKGACTYLNHESVVACGLHFFGSPHQPAFHDWGFNLDRGEETRRHWASIALQEQRPIDVLITHGPPLGHGDVCMPGHRPEGCWDLLDFVERWPPSLHVFGHIHEGYGVTTNGRTVFANASIMNEAYDVDAPNAPIVVDVPLPGTEAALSYRQRLASSVSKPPEAE